MEILNTHNLIYLFLYNLDLFLHNSKFQIHTISSDFQNSNYSVSQISFFTQIHTITKYTYSKSPNLTRSSRLEVSSNLARPHLDRLGGEDLVGVAVLRESVTMKERKVVTED